MKQKVNWPNHLLYPGDVRSHLDKDILLNLALRDYRAREIKAADIIESYQDARGNNVKKLVFANHKYEIYGYLVNDTMFVDRTFWDQAYDSWFLTTPLKPGQRVFARGEGTNEMVSHNPAVYIFMDADEFDGTVYEEDGAHYYLVDEWEKYGDITNRGELLAHTYRFQWNAEKGHFVGLEWNDVYKQIRRPWMTKIIQDLVGYDAANIADAFKLITFILHKIEPQLSDVERAILEPYMQSDVSETALERLGERKRVLNELLEAYASEKPLRTGDDVKTDFIFNHPLIKY